MFRVDDFLNRKHDMKSYNCWDFVREILFREKGVDIGKRTPDQVTLSALKKQIDEHSRLFPKLEKPKNFCIVLFKREKRLPHIGIFYKGKILHLPERSHARFDPISIAALGFTTVEFFDFEQGSGL